MKVKKYLVIIGILLVCLILFQSFPYRLSPEIIHLSRSINPQLIIRHLSY